MSVNATGLRVWLLLVIVMSLPGRAGLHAATLEEVLDLPPTPGALALLIGHAGQQNAKDRLAEGLRAANPERRAAAARVVAVIRSPSFREQLLLALDQESDAGAAREEIRALAQLDEPGDQARLVEAALRFGWPMCHALGMQLARIQGTGSLPVYLSSLRSPEWPVSARIDFFALATRGDKAAWSELSQAVLGDADVLDWRAMLEVATREHFELERPAAMSALAHKDSALNAATAWFLSRQIVRNPSTGTGDILATLRRSGEAFRDAGVDADDQFGREMLQRVLGQSPVTNDGWVARLEQPGFVALDDWRYTYALNRFLTKQEFKALKTRLEGALAAGKKLPKWLLAPSKPQEGKPRRPPAASAGSVVRIVSGLPPGMARDLLTTTHCEAVRSGFPQVVDARVLYDTMGRPKRMHLGRMDVGRGCVDAFKTIFALALPPAWHLPDPKIEERLLLFVDRDFLLHIDEEPLGPVSLQSWESSPVDPPKRTRFVKPVFPEDAQRRGEEGKATLAIGVTKDGHVSEVQTIETTIPPFIVSALWAVTQWTYEPARFRGAPVPTRLVVIVEYNLK